MAAFENLSQPFNLTVRLFELIQSLSEDEQRRLLRVLAGSLSKGKRKHEEMIKEFMEML
jgi:hypothetical protein